MSFYNYMTIIFGASQCTMLPVALDYIHIWLKQRIGRDVISLSLIWDSFHFWVYVRVQLTQVKSSAPREA